jgi:hypothetical protein
VIILIEAFGSASAVSQSDFCYSSFPPHIGHVSEACFSSSASSNPQKKQKQTLHFSSPAIPKMHNGEGE